MSSITLFDNKNFTDMNNKMVAHLWANEQQESAFGSNFYFNGASIYSWGTHFEAGRIVRNKRGEIAYLINEERYSSSTSQHQSYIRSAIPLGAMIFSVGYNMNNLGNMLFVVNQLEAIKDSAERYRKARTEISYRNIWEPFKSLMAYIKFFDLGTPKQLLKKNVNEWLGTKHELAWKSDKVKQEHVRNLKHILQIMLNHQALEVLGTVNVIVDEICGEETWTSYTERCQKYRIVQEVREAKRIENDRIIYEKGKKSLEEKIQMWKSGEIRDINLLGYSSNDEPNVWLRIKNGKVETSKGIILSQTEAERLWKRIKSFHDGAQFQHDLARDSSGNNWVFNKYQNDMLTAGCHRIAYSEMEIIAKQLGLV